MMTAAEFEAIPIMGEKVVEFKEVDGKTMVRAVFNPSQPLSNDPNEPLYWVYGACKWQVGKYDSVTYRKRVETYWVGENVLEPRPA